MPALSPRTIAVVANRAAAPRRALFGRVLGTIHPNRREPRPLAHESRDDRRAMFHGIQCRTNKTRMAPTLRDTIPGRLAETLCDQTAPTACVLDSRINQVRHIETTVRGSRLRVAYFRRSLG